MQESEKKEVSHLNEANLNQDEPKKDSEVQQEIAHNNETIQEIEVNISEESSQINNNEESAEAEESFIEDEILEDIDFTTYSLEQLYEYVSGVLEQEPNAYLTKQVNVAREKFYHLLETEKDNFKNNIDTEKANNEQDEDSLGNQIVYPVELTELENKFKEAARSFRKARKEFVESKEQEKEKNLELKEKLLVEMRILVEEAHTNTAFDQFKNIQEKWNEIGQIPQANFNDVKRNFEALRNQFFDKRKIFKDILEYDRKKNLEIKEEIIVNINKLLEQENVKEIQRQLNRLKTEWRNTGEIPKENIEDVNSRYKDAIIAINTKIDHQLEELQKIRELHFEAKLLIIQKLDEIASGDYKTLKEWRTKNDELTEWIEEWKKIGSAPKDKIEDLKNNFNIVIKKFNTRKNEFFRELQDKQVENLQKKQAIIEKIKQILANEESEYPKFRQEILDLQKDWKEIGAASKKFNDKIWEEFRAECDKFFNTLNKERDARKSEETINLSKKNELIADAEQVLEGKKEIEDLNAYIRDLQKNFRDIGYVPMNHKEKLRNKFDLTVNKLYDLLKENRKKKKIETHKISADDFKEAIINLESDSDGEFHITNEKKKLQRDKKQIEEELSTLENNLQFFKFSSKNSSMGNQFTEKVAKLKEDLVDIDAKIKTLNISLKKIAKKSEDNN
jgi:hypothetical protein